jgi:hypothetical protein
MFKSSEEFLDQVRIKEDKLDKRMRYERKQKNPSNIFEGVIGLNSWDNQERIEFI